MIVYGDSEFYAQPGELARHLGSAAEAARREPSLERLRTWLILAGQVEQAVSDLGEEKAGALERITDAVAKAFVGVWYHEPGLGQSVERAAELSGNTELPTEPMQVRLPEGFASYALYPEQYILSAEKWMRGKWKDEPVTVIGLRSIGTSLSAVVAATFRRAGYSVHRVTLRPSGHPFQRQASEAPRELTGASRVVVVDEGPGLSGSSMAAAAISAREVGAEGVQVSFFPGHPNGPGKMASEDIRAIWQETEQVTTNVDDLKWDGNSLREVLVASTLAMLGGKVKNVEDFSGGHWRQAVYRDRAGWPAVAFQFECPKVRVELQDGRAVLWKFAGMGILQTGLTGAEDGLVELSERSKAGWNARPLGHRLGYLAMPWIEGTVLRRDDLTGDLWQHMMRYVKDVRKPAMARAEAVLAIERIGTLLTENCREALGDRASSRIKSLEEMAKSWVRTHVPKSYGDGRLAPHEWVRDLDGRIWKVDGSGHGFDHTAVGLQSWIWDLAGLMTEWDVEPVASGYDVPGEVLSFYGAAYAAFRMGLMVEAGKAMEDSGDKARSERAAIWYGYRLNRWLG